MRKGIHENKLVEVWNAHRPKTDEVKSSIAEYMNMNGHAPTNTISRLISEPDLAIKPASHEAGIIDILDFILEYEEYISRPDILRAMIQCLNPRGMSFSGAISERLVCFHFGGYRLTAAVVDKLHPDYRALIEL